MTRATLRPREAPSDRSLRRGPTARTWIARAWIGAAWIAGAPLLACSAPPGAEPASTASAPVYGGVEDDDAHQNDAVVALEIGNDGTTFTLCSGALIAPDVVLTARHCVSAENNMSVSCDDNGVSATPPDFGADVAASSVLVYTGPTAALRGTPAATGKALFHPAGNTLCNLDLALVVLDAPIAGITPLSVRLEGSALANESVRAVGYGENDQNAPLGTRFRKDGVAVLAVGSTVSASGTPLGGNEFEVGESVCSGDSGSPAIDEATGAVVGIVSRGGACTDDFGHVYTALAGFASLFQQAFAAAGTAPVQEGSSWPPASAAPPPAGSALPGPRDGGAAGTPSPPATSAPGDAPPGNRAPVNLRAGVGPGCAVSGWRRGVGESSLAVAGCALALACVRRRRRLR